MKIIFNIAMGAQKIKNFLIFFFYSFSSRKKRLRGAVCVFKALQAAGNSPTHPPGPLLFREKKGEFEYQAFLRYPISGRQ
ncbi:MAG TPA: hypothetical protein PKO25_07835 [Spirochaetota bacterium]|nr:hypothetical protein [Spirochaetota bacterium]HPI13343.1 hypothetical protein [Spirochaetota bacterium]